MISAALFLGVKKGSRFDLYVFVSVIFIVFRSVADRSSSRGGSWDRSCTGFDAFPESQGFNAPQRHIDRPQTHHSRWGLGITSTIWYFTHKHKKTLNKKITIQSCCISTVDTWHLLISCFPVHTTAGCLDRLFICPAWARKGYCDSKRILMQKHCPSSCDFCYGKRPVISDQESPKKKKVISDLDNIKCDPHCSLFWPILPA